MTIKAITTDKHNQDFITLVSHLDVELYNRYGDGYTEYEIKNALTHITDVVLIYQDDIPAACGSFKLFDSDTVEIKRIYVKDDFRRKGYASLIISKLEKIAAMKGFSKAFLITGVKQPEAVKLYQRLGYREIPKFGDYLDDELCICMEKTL
jgi:ribosomal protein S18 acetylase RimI-like enzyme